MSKEKRPEPEHAPEFEPKEKIQSKCWSCEHTVRSSMANTNNYLFTKQPWWNRTHLKCLDEACGSVTVLFHDTITEKSLAAAMQYPTSIYEYADQDEDWETIKEIRAKSVGAKDVEPRNLSDRQSKNIEHWGEFLQHTVIDASDFGG